MSTVPTPEELFERYRQGDWSALEALYDEFERPLYRFAVRMLGSLEDGEDALQEMWCRVHRHQETWRAGTSVRKWLFCILRNVCFDMLRRRKIMVLSEADADQEGMEISPGESALGDWYSSWGSMAFDPLFRRAVEVCLQQLAPMYRVLIVCAFDGMSYAEVAEQEEIPESQVKGRLYRAREQLKELLTRRGYKPEGIVQSQKQSGGRRG